MLKNFSAFELFILVLFFISAKTEFAGNYYVDPAAGNDNNSGLSPLSAWKTFAKVNDFNFSNGDTISLKCGERFYNETLIPNTDSLTINSYGSGGKPVIDGLGKINCIEVSKKSFINIINLKFVNGFPRDVVLNNDYFIKIDNCTIDSCAGTGILNQNLYTGMGSHLIIRNSAISYAGASTGGGHGIYIDGTKNTLLEYDTLIYNKNNNLKIAYGYENPYYTDSLTVRYCIIKYAGDQNISDDGSRYSKFYYNVLENKTHSWSVNISLTTSSGYCASNNQYFNNTFLIHDPDNRDNAGIFIYTSSYITNIHVYNNIFFISDSSKGWAIYSQKGPIGSWNINNNVYYSVNDEETHIWHWAGSTVNSFKNWQSNGFDKNGIYGNPLFISLDSLELQNESPAINMGNSNSIIKDINGNTVPSPAGTKPDAGAFENTVSYGIHDSLSAYIINRKLNIKSFSLSQNYPNPFNPSTAINYQLSAHSFVTLKIYDILGNPVKTLVDGFKPKGKYKIIFNGSNLASGVYFFCLMAIPAGRQAGNFISTRKMLLLK